MRELFRYADKNNDNSLSLKEIITLLKHLNIEVDHDQAKQIFEVISTPSMCTVYKSVVGSLVCWTTGLYSRSTV